MILLSVLFGIFATMFAVIAVLIAVSHQNVDGLIGGGVIFALLSIASALLSIANRYYEGESGP